MERDGSLRSIWQDGQANYQPSNTWEKDTVYDVVITGAGITGLTTALLLQQQGKKCLIAEAHTIGYGTSLGTSAHLNTILDSPYTLIEKNFSQEAAKQMATASRQAIDLIEVLIDELDIACNFKYKTGYLFAQNDEEATALDAIKEASERAGIVVNWSPQVPGPFSVTKACRIGFQGQLHIGKYLTGLAAAFEAAGGVILQHCVVSSAEEAGHITLTTSLGEIKAAKLVYATHIPPGVNILHFRNAPYRSYVMACRLNTDQYPDGLVYDMKEPYNYFRTEEIDGIKYLIAGGFDHKTGHETDTAQIFTRQEAFLRTLFDIASIDYKWSSQYYNPVDGLPYIGLLPGHENIYTGTGYSGNGLVLGTLAAQMISDAITGHDNPYTDLLRPSRIKPIAGFADFIKENADVVSHFIGDRFSYEQISTLSELAKGAAVVAEWEGRKVALYKDEQGKVMALDPVCPHTKCIVAWNSAEKSWDCPCHGGRFAPNGTLLTGPASTNLTVLLWEEMDGD